MTDRIRAHVEDIINSGALKRGARVTRLFQHLVTEELEGRGEQLTPYGIAVDALRAQADFDPAMRSTLRVEMHRLRAALATYYSLRPNSPLVIEFPLGSYRFSVRENERPIPAAISSDDAEENGRVETPPLDATGKSSPRRMLAFSFLMTLFLAGASAAMMTRQSNAARRQCPVDWGYVSVSSHRTSSDANEIPDYFVAELLKAIGAYEQVHARFDIDQKCQTSNIYDMSVRRKAMSDPSQIPQAELTLVHRRSGQTIWTYSPLLAPPADDVAAIANLTVIANELNDRHGALVTDILKRDWPVKKRHDEFVCFLEAADFLSKTPAEQDEISACLEAMAASGSQSVRAIENLALLERLQYWGSDGDAARLDKAAALVAQIEDAPDVGHITLVERLRNARVARPLNLYLIEDLMAELDERFRYNNTAQYELMTVYGFVYGDWRKAVYWARQLETANNAKEVGNGYTFAAAAIVAGNWREAEKRLGPLTLSSVKLLFETKVAVELGDNDRLKEIWRTARDSFDMDIDGGIALLASRNYHQSINDPLADGLKKAKVILVREGAPPKTARD